jgi:hypothetical protein
MLTIKMKNTFCIQYTFFVFSGTKCRCVLVGSAAAYLLGPGFVFALHDFISFPDLS